MRKLFAAALVAALAAPASAARYDIDPVHSGVTFKIRHIVTKTPGRFTKFSGAVDYEEGKPESWKAEAVIDAASINTDNEKRDAHLRKPDFFDVEKHPTITFKSTKVTDVKDGKGKLHGDLTMHGVTKPVVLDLEVGGVGQGMGGENKAGFSASGTLKRSDFGVGSGMWAGTGVLGDDIAISIEIEANEAKPAPKK